MQTLRVVAPGKLNLCLHITGKRGDGYHLLESLVVFTDFGDTLDIAPSDSMHFSVVGPFAGELQQAEDNLVMRAMQMLKKYAGCKAGAKITLHKHIPVGAGLGGGSADAAAALRGLMALWNIEIALPKLQAMALQLGSDVPVCLASQTAWMSGIGDHLTPVTLNVSAGILLVNPLKSLLTAEVFRRFTGPFAASSDMPQSVDSLDALVHGISTKNNMLEEPAGALLPVIGDILAAIRATPGCLLARMSGSGATCFGIYADAASAQKAAKLIHAAHSEWWCEATKLCKTG